MSRYIMAARMGVSIMHAGMAFAKKDKSGAGDGAAAPAAPAESAAAPATAATDQAKESKSIVPKKYAGRYKDGGSGELSDFIKKQCTGKEGFEYTAFFQLCRDNGVNADQVKKYEDIVASKVQGANGRARMTLRNMLETIARKNGKLKGLDGDEIAISVPARVVGGAAAKAQETAATAAAG